MLPLTRTYLFITLGRHKKDFTHRMSVKPSQKAPVLLYCLALNLLVGVLIWHLYLPLSLSTELLTFCTSGMPETLRISPT